MREGGGLHDKSVDVDVASAGCEKAVEDWTFGFVQCLDFSFGGLLPVVDHDTQLCDGFTVLVHLLGKYLGQLKQYP